MRPPHYHKTDSPTRNCHHCVYVDRRSGLCKKYGVLIDRDGVCDTFEPRKGIDRLADRLGEKK